MSKLLKEYIEFLVKENLEKELSTLEAFVELYKLFDVGDFLDYYLSGADETTDITSPESFSSYLSQQLGLSPENIQKIVLVLQSVILFTSGDMEAVRDPSLVSDKVPSRNRHKLLSGDGLSPNSYFVFSSTRETYISAKSIIKELASANFQQAKGGILSVGKKIIESNLSGAVYRGMGLTNDVFNKLKVGSVFDHGDMSSWSFDKEVADGFAVDSIKDKAVIFVCRRPKRGVPVEHVSKFPDELEFLSGGLVKITGISEKRSTHLFEPITVYEIEYI